ncbi:unnamed protein product [Prunus armeniaca]
MSEGDHVWSTDMLEVSGRWVGEVGDGPLVPLTYCDENDIHKKLDLGPNMINVHQTLNIFARFCGLRWLLSEHQNEADGLPPAEDVDRWELHGSDLDDLPVERDKSSTKLPHSSMSKSSVKGSRLLGMSLWELLLHLPGLSASSARTVRRSMACKRSGIFYSGICSNCLKPMIYPVRRLLRSRVRVACADPGIKLRGLYICLAITTRLQSHEQSSTELTQCCEFRPRELKSRLLEQRVLKLRELPIQKLVIASLVKFDTHVEATEASKHVIVANTYKLGYLDCRNSASLYCHLKHEDVEEQIADEAAIEEDNSQGGVADKARPYAKEQAGEVVE